jgi:hypothetical protein
MSCSICDASKRPLLCVYFGNSTLPSDTANIILFSCITCVKYRLLAHTNKSGLKIYRLSYEVDYSLALIQFD